jgi:hypothetical protein
MSEHYTAFEHERHLAMTSFKCQWRHNNEYDRWDTSCDDICVALNNETPKDFGFKVCPYCGKTIDWVDEQDKQEPTDQQAWQACLAFHPDIINEPEGVKAAYPTVALKWLRAWRKVGM